jgi:hypothetical protein
MAAPQLTVAPEPADEPIVLVLGGQTHVVKPDDPAWPIAFHARETDVSLELAERDLRGKRALIAKLRKDEAAERQSYPQRPMVEDIHAEWARECKHPNSKLTAERFDAVRSMIEAGYTREQFARAIAGAAYDPFSVKRKNGTVKRFDDLELICRDGKHFEDFANRAPRGEWDGKQGRIV